MPVFEDQRRPSSVSELVVAHQLPIRVDRRGGAELISRFFFPISHRSLETWPVPYQVVGKRSIYSTEDLFLEAQRRLDDAPVRRPEVR
jgi:hypothetical protein